MNTLHRANTEPHSPVIEELSRVFKRSLRLSRAKSSISPQIIKQRSFSKPRSTNGQLLFLRKRERVPTKPSKIHGHSFQKEISQITFSQPSKAHFGLFPQTDNFESASPTYSVFPQKTESDVSFSRGKDSINLPPRKSQEICLYQPCRTQDSLLPLETKHVSVLKRSSTSRRSLSNQLTNKSSFSENYRTKQCSDAELCPGMNHATHSKKIRCSVNKKCRSRLNGQTNRSLDAKYQLAPQTNNIMGAGLKFDRSKTHDSVEVGLKLIGQTNNSAVNGHTIASNKKKSAGNRHKLDHQTNNSSENGHKISRQTNSLLGEGLKIGLQSNNSLEPEGNVKLQINNSLESAHKTVPHTNSLLEFARKILPRTNSSLGSVRKVVPHTNNSQPAGLKLGPNTSRHTAEDFNTCLHNIGSCRQQSNLYIGQRHLKSCQYGRPDAPSGILPSYCRCRFFNPFDNQSYARLVWKLKSPPMNLKSIALTGKCENGSYSAAKSRLAAWGQSGGSNFRCRSSDDLCLFKKAISQSPPHSLVLKTHQFSETYVSKIRALNYKIMESSRKENSLGTGSESSLFDSDKETSDEYSSVDISNSDLTRGVWSKMSVSDGERTSLGLELLSASQEERLFPLSENETSQGHTLLCKSARDTSPPPSSHDKHHLRQLFKRSVLKPLRLLKRRHQCAFLSETALMLSGIEQGHQLNLSHFSRQSPDDNADQLSSSSDEIDSERSSEANSMLEDSFGTCRQLWQAKVPDKNNKYTALPKTHLERALSFPGTNIHSERRARHCLMISQNMKELMALHDAYIAQQSALKKARNSGMKFPFRKPMILKTKLPDILLNSRQNKAAFSTQPSRSLQVLKDGVFVTLVVAILIMCSFLAFLATLASCCNKSLVKYF